ncbi:MAG TPA: ShlB/FhaC/HecB family hemolysin secretion/activation protein, partial [Alphaproteobacteria bacterium]
AELTRLQRIVKDFNILVGVKGQISNGPLLASEEFGIGGMSYGYGRGYDPSEILGDEGVVGKLEVQWNTHVFDEHITSLQLFGFYDVGAVWNDDPTTPADKRNSVASVGLGARARLTQAINADATLAFPMTKDVDTQDDTDPRLFVSLTSRF